jgi:hypothetical protein
MAVYRWFLPVPLVVLALYVYENVLSIVETAGEFVMKTFA